MNQIKTGILKTVSVNILAVFMREQKCPFLQSLHTENTSEMQPSEFSEEELLVQVQVHSLGLSSSP